MHKELLAVEGALLHMERVGHALMLVIECMGDEANCERCEPNTAAIAFIARAPMFISLLSMALDELDSQLELASTANKTLFELLRQERAS